MTMEEYIQLIVPVFGIVSVALSAAFSYYFAKRKQILTDEKKLKEKFYLDLIGALSGNVIDDDREKAMDKLADIQNKSLLVGSPDMVNCLMKLHDYCKVSNTNRESDEQDKLLTALIKAMREDLYGNSKVNKNFPQIHFSGKH